jgi:energy-coupling factor transporter ATP-binding protein EcfA2
VQELSVAYDGRPVLRDVSLEIRPGECVAVMGDNGSGKTTFLHSLLGLTKPSGGCVEVLAQDTRRTPVSQLARDVGLVFQNPDHQLFAESVWREAVLAPQNLGGLDGATETWVRSLLVRSGLGGREQVHPYRLSYGEKRRLNLISVLAHAPRLILLDEVLIGQDPENASFLLNLLQEQVERGCAVVMVIHHPGVARSYAQRLVFFQGGRVVVDAPTEEAFRQLASQGHHVYLPSRRNGSQVEEPAGRAVAERPDRARSRRQGMAVEGPVRDSGLAHDGGTGG